MSDSAHVFDMMPAGFKDQQRWRAQIMLSIWLSLFFLLLIGLITVGLKLQSQQRTEQLAQLQQQEQALNLKNQTLQGRLAQRQRLQAQLHVLQPASNASSALQLSAQLSTRFRIWLREWHWSQSEANTAIVRLQAVAPNHDSLSQLLSALNADKRIDDADIVDSRLATDLGDQAVLFELLARQSDASNTAGNPP